MSGWGSGWCLGKAGEGFSFELIRWRSWDEDEVCVESRDVSDIQFFNQKASREKEQNLQREGRRRSKGRKKERK